MSTQTLLITYTFLGLYTIERSLFVFRVSNRIKPTKKAWLTFIPFLTYIALFFISVIEFSMTVSSLNLIITFLGIFIFALGVYLRYQAIIAFGINKQRWRSDIDTEDIYTIVRSGPYNFVRHPYYLSVILELCGIALSLNAYRAIILILSIQVPLLWKRIRVEESGLVEKFGGKYLSYRKQVCIFLPLRSKQK